MNIQGLSAIVTGGASGMGAATARHLAGLGAKVTVLDVNEDAVLKTAHEIGGLGLVCDVTDGASAERALDQARSAHGPARIAVNCAGIAPAQRIVGRDGPMPLENFRSVIEVNLIGSFNILRLAAADMAKLDPLDSGERGVIVNTASVAVHGFAGRGPAHCLHAEDELPGNAIRLGRLLGLATAYRERQPGLRFVAIADPEPGSAQLRHYACKDVQPGHRTREAAVTRRVLQRV